MVRLVVVLERLVVLRFAGVQWEAWFLRPLVALSRSPP